MLETEKTINVTRLRDYFKNLRQISGDPNLEFQELNISKQFMLTEYRDKATGYKIVLML